MAILFLGLMLFVNESIANK